MAQASKFQVYVLNIFRDQIALTVKGYLDRLDISTWSDLESVNNKTGWESLGIVSSCLLSGSTYDSCGDLIPILQTMAGIEINLDSDDFQ